MLAALYGQLGLAQRAAKLASGAEAVRLQIASQNVRLLIIAEDAALRTKEEFIHLTGEGKITYSVIGKSADLGAAIGKAPRAVVAVLDSGFAKSMISKIEAAKKPINDPCGGD